MTCWNRLRNWQAAGVWDQIHQILLNHLRSADRIDFERFIVDTSHVRAVGGGEETGPSLGCPVCAHFVHYTSRRNRVPPRRGFRVEVQ